MKLKIGYPDRQSELDLLARESHRMAEPVVEQVLVPGELSLLQEEVSRIAVELPVREYLVSLAEATRQHPAFAIGLSPRGLLQWQRAAQARAVLHGRTFVTPDDVQEVALPVLSVRLSGRSGGLEAMILQVIESTPVQGSR